MKILGLLLLALISLVSPVDASEGDASALPATLEATQCALQQAIEVSAAALGIPEPQPAHHCNAQKFCADGCFISCVGHVSCTVQAASVTCDSVVTPCPYPSCTPPTGCLNPCDYCECKARGGMGCLNNCTQ
jgi:hypothetical protein